MFVRTREGSNRSGMIVSATHNLGTTTLGCFEAVSVHFGFLHLRSVDKLPAVNLWGYFLLNYVFCCSFILTLS